jgi:hypothetical protein
MELNTYGDLKKVIKAISLRQKGEKIGNVALDTVIGLIPGGDIAKTTFDFIKAAISKPDTKKTNTWLDKLDIDDEMSAIIDDTVENGFMKAMAASIEKEPNDKDLESDFNMNAKMVEYLKNSYKGRTVSGIKENNIIMKKSKFLNLIKEEILNTLQEQTLEKEEQLQGSFKPELFKKLMGDKFDLNKFTSAMTKLKNNQSRSTIDNAFLGDIVRALMFTDDNKMLTDIFTYLRTLKTK